MKRIVFVLLLIIAVFRVYGQEKMPNDSTSRMKQLLAKPANERLNNYLQMDAPQPMDTIFRLDIITPLQKPAPKPIDFVVPPLNTYVGPPLTTDYVLNPHFPYADNYTYAGLWGISDRAWATSLSTNNRYPSIGRMRSVDIQLNYKLTDWMYVSGGAYASKYAVDASIYKAYTMRNDNHTTHLNDWGVNSSMKFILSDRVRFNAYGQYSINADKNKLGGPLMDMYSQTYYGGTIEVKITDKFGIEGGMLRELNPFTGKWVNKPIIMPVFYK